MTVRSDAAEDALLATLRASLSVPVVSDAPDGLGLLHRTMDERLRPLAPGMRLVGRSQTVLTADHYQRPSDPYRLEIEAIDALRPTAVMVAATNGSRRTSFWGELLSTAALARGANGCLIDGHVRDVLRIIELDVPIFATGIRPVDASYRSAVVAHAEPVEDGGVRVEPGDVIVGDYGGGVAIPRACLAKLVDLALAKVEGENQTRVMLQQGASLRQVNDEFGAL